MANTSLFSSIKSWLPRVTVTNEAGGAVDELKLDVFLDFVARMIARRWIQEQRVQEPESAHEPDDHSDEACSSPEGGLDK